MLNRSKPFRLDACPSLDDECKLAFGVAGGCLVVGTCGWAMNSVSAGSSTLGGLLFVGGFYFLLGLASLYNRARQENTATANSPVRCDDLARAFAEGCREGFELRQNASRNGDFREEEPLTAGDAPWKLRMHSPFPEVSSNPQSTGLGIESGKSPTYDQRRFFFRT